MGVEKKMSLEKSEVVNELGKVISFCGWSQKISIHREGEVIKLSGRYENLYHHSCNKKSLKIVTSSPEEVTKGERRRDSNLSHSWYYDWEATLSNSTWAIVLGERSDSGGGVSRFIEAVHIWGNPDVKKMAEVILSWRHHAGADWEFMEAIIHETGLLSWIKTKIEPSEIFENYREKIAWGEMGEWQRRKVADVPDEVIIAEMRFSLRQDPDSGRFQLKASDPGHSGTEVQASVEFNFLNVEQQIEVLPKVQSEYLRGLLAKSRQ